MRNRRFSANNCRSCHQGCGVPPSSMQRCLIATILRMNSTRSNRVAWQAGVAEIPVAPKGLPTASAWKLGHCPILRKQDVHEGAVVVSASFSSAYLRIISEATLLWSMMESVIVVRTIPASRLAMGSSSPWLIA